MQHYTPKSRLFLHVELHWFLERARLRPTANPESNWGAASVTFSQSKDSEEIFTDSSRRASIATVDADI